MERLGNWLMSKFRNTGAHGMESIKWVRISIENNKKNYSRISRVYDWIPLPMREHLNHVVIRASIPFIVNLNAINSNCIMEYKNTCAYPNTQLLCFSRFCISSSLLRRVHFYTFFSSVHCCFILVMRIKIFHHRDLDYFVREL